MKDPTHKGAAPVARRVVLEPGRGMGHYWRDLWQFRELLYFLTWRDVLVRYKETAIGVAWAVLRPVVTMIIFSLVFGSLSKLPSAGAPYPVLVLAALLPWQFFSTALVDGSGALVNNANMLTKVYFPRLIVPSSAILVGAVDFFISLLVLGGLMAWYGQVPSWRIVTLPAFIALAMLAAFGFGTWFAALTVKYRDVRYVIPFVAQVGLYASPVGFSSAVVPERWRLLYCVNPMVGVIDGFRWALIGSEPMFWPGLGLAVVVSVIAAAWGLAYFRATERQFADLI